MSASGWSRLAALAWLVAFGQFGLATVMLQLDLGTSLFGTVIYGIWTLVLGALLLLKPSRTILTLSFAFAIVSIVIYWQLSTRFLTPPLWLGWLPDAVAGVASLVAVRSWDQHRPR